MRESGRERRDGAYVATIGIRNVSFDEDVNNSIKPFAIRAVLEYSNMKFQVALVVSFLLLSGYDAFTPSSSSLRRSDTMVHVQLLLMNTKDQQSLFSHDTRTTTHPMKQHTMKDLLLCTTAAIVLTFSPMQQVSALSSDRFDHLPTIQIADTVKELDFSLPSYDEIKSYKATTETVKSLSVQPPPFDPTSISLRTSSSQATPTTSEKSATSSDGTSTETTTTTTTPASNPLSSILPSMNKKGPKQKASYDGYTF